MKGKNIDDNKLFDVKDEGNVAVLKEKHLKTKYRVFQKPNLEMKSKYDFLLPEKNQLIPGSFEIFTKGNGQNEEDGGGEQMPVKVEFEGMELWLL